MHNLERDAAVMAEKQRKLMETGYRLFSERTIEAVSMNEVARESGVGIATMYRYYENKLDFVAAVSNWKWSEYWEGMRTRGDRAGSQLTAAQEYGFFLNVFVEMYRKAPDLLRFNQYMNIYARTLGTGLNSGNPLPEVIDKLADRFRLIWEKGEQDGTLRTDISWSKAFSASLHLMLAAATRYAVGLLYQPPEGMDPVSELELLKNLLLNQFAARKRKGEENGR